MSNGVRIVVCLKQVPDPEAPASSFRINGETRKITVDGVPPVINPYDECALELALRLKDKTPETHISAVCIGPKPARAVLLRALAVGADELYMIEGLNEDADAAVTSKALAAVIRTMELDLILASRQAADSNAGVVGLMLAELLDVPAVSWARKIEVDGDYLVVERIVSGEYQILRRKPPALVVVSQEAPLMRMPKLPDLRKAKQKPIHQKKVEEFGIDMSAEKSLQCVKLEAPRRERECQFFEADAPAEAGAQLVKALREKGLLGIE